MSLRPAPSSTNPVPNSLTFPPSISDISSDRAECPPTPELGIHSVQETPPNGSIHENDIVIAVMGLTGAGKSSFVKTATEDTQVLVGHNLTSKTRDVRAVRCTRRRNVVLVDTPGFDDTHQSDVEILKTIAKWLKDTYQNNIKLAGILYLHRISDVRMAGTPLRNLGVFKDLCGDDSLKNIVLVTTMWDEVESESIGSERETELTSNFWNDMIYLGSRTFRYEGTFDSAWKIINGLDLAASFQRRAPLQIQREMVDRGLQLHETSAGKTLFRSLVEEVKKVWAKIRGGTRRPAVPGRPRSGLRRTVFRRTSVRSSSSETSRPVTPSSDTLSIASTLPSSVADSIASRCNAANRHEALSILIRGLKIVHEVAEMIPFPGLRGCIGTVLCIAKLIQEMNGTHHVINQVVENSGWLLEEITEYAKQTRLSANLKRSLKSFQRELVCLLNVVEKVAKRGPITRFLLHEADIHAISECNTSVQMIYERLEVKIAIESHRAVACLQEEVARLRNDKESRECRCGSSVIREEE